VTTSAHLPLTATSHHDVQPTRPAATFHNGHHCTRYWTIAGFQECAHGNVRRIGARRRAARRKSGAQPYMPARQSE
jgi:hypothetical protein